MSTIFKKQIISSFNALALVVPIAAMLISATAGGTGDKSPAADRTNPKGSSKLTVEDCGSCHKDIYKSWINSRHNQSASNAFFKAANDRFQGLGDEVKLPNGKMFCKNCHEPFYPDNVAVGDSKGVRCTFCHSVKEVRLDRRPTPFILDPGEVKYGPYAEVQSPAHLVQQSDLFTNSQLCAGCHEWRNDAGVPILSTFSEWKESAFAAKNVQCQTCHMSEVSGQIVDPKLERIKSGKVNIHQFSGGHSASQLHEAVEMNVKEIVRDGETMTVKLEVKNTGAGHYFPTGMPSRRVEVEVLVSSSNGKPQGRKAVLQRNLVDAEGKPVRMAFDFFHRSARIESDSRLKPSENREFTFQFPITKTDSYQIDSHLVYFDDPFPGEKEPYRALFRQAIRWR